jgi:2,3,4,5-tetrahydropyridine-2-carboxylate N-succinyltransferase
MTTATFESIIDAAFERRTDISPGSVPTALAETLPKIIDGLNSGRFRVAEKLDGVWTTHQWLKKAVLLYFRAHDNRLIANGELRYFDKVPARFAHYTAVDFREGGYRVVPPAVARAGTYLGKNVILMPSYVNIGAYIDDGTMVDTWATVGSCAQIGKNVHLSGGVGIGGVLEPLQANPTIIEDNCFIGARSEIVEGVIVEEHAVISMGVFIGQSTKIYDRATGEVHYGRVPSGSVVVPGSLPASDGSHSLACAVIVKRVDATYARRRRSTSCFARRSCSCPWLTQAIHTTLTRRPWRSRASSLRAARSHQTTAGVWISCRRACPRWGS